MDLLIVFAAGWPFIHAILANQRTFLKHYIVHVLRCLNYWALALLYLNLKSTYCAILET